MDENKVDFEKMTPAEEKPDCQGERADWRSDDEEKAGDETG